MRTYVVQPGDSPAQIAIKYAGCPRCVVDLVRVNPHKPIVKHSNGFTTFRELRVGEKLNLPDKWWSKAFDELPPAYFAALPHPDGVTPTKRQTGVLGDYAALDEVSLEVLALASKSDQAFSQDVNKVAARIDASVLEAASSSNSTAVALAETTQASTRYARSRNVDLSVAIGTGDQPATTQARLDIQNALSTAVGTARVALQTLYTAPSIDVEIGGATIEPPPAPIPVTTTTRRSPAPAPAPVPVPAPVVVTAPQSAGLSTGSLFGIGLIGVGVVGGAIYLALKYSPRSGRKR